MMNTFTRLFVLLALCFTITVVADAGSEDNYYELAEELIAIGQEKEAIAIYVEMQRVFDSPLIAGRAAHLAGSALEGERDHKEALVQYLRCVYLYPGNPDRAAAMFRCGRLYQNELKKYGLAKKWYDQLVKEYPKSPSAIEGLFSSAEMAIAKAKDPTLALQTFERIVSEYPKSNRAGDAILARARIYEKKKDPKSAIEEYTRFIEKFPDGAGKAYYLRGKTEESTGDLAGAIKSYEAAIEGAGDAGHVDDAKKRISKCKKKIKK
jgi:TolA-binding protein